MKEKQACLQATCIIYVRPVEVLNFWTLKHCCNQPKNLPKCPYSREMPQKDSEEMAKRIDPDKTTPLEA